MYPNYVYLIRSFFTLALSPSPPETPWTAACQTSLSFIVSWSLLKLMSIDSMMPSSHLILCRPFFPYPQSFPASGSFAMS